MPLGKYRGASADGLSHRFNPGAGRAAAAAAGSPGLDGNREGRPSPSGRNRPGLRCCRAGRLRRLPQGGAAVTSLQGAKHLDVEVAAAAIGFDHRLTYAHDRSCLQVLGAPCASHVKR
jgi:hypothetical protein